MAIRVRCSQCKQHRYRHPKFKPNRDAGEVYICPRCKRQNELNKITNKEFYND